MKLKHYLVCLGIFSFGSISSNEHPCHCSRPTAFSEWEQMKFCSQASQDEFVYTLLYRLLNKQDTGYYLEIGAGPPQESNNSYFFEKQLGWIGVSLELSDQWEGEWQTSRSNPLLIQDAMCADYGSILASFPQTIDYLSLDVDDAYDVVLRQIPFDTHIFKMITIEHDFYRYGDTYRKKEREILNSKGYHLLCADVSFSGMTFEDWWVHPSAFPPSVFSALTSLNLNAKDNKKLLKILKKAVKS